MKKAELSAPKNQSILSSVDKSELLGIVGMLQKKKIVVIGDVMLAVYIKGSVARISPEAPIPVVEINEKDTKMPGGAANVAANITALGGKASIIGTTGRDLAGRELVSQLKKYGVDTSGMLALGDRPTTEKIRVIAHTQQVVRIDREVKSALSDKQQDQVIRCTPSFLRQACAGLFSSSLDCLQIRFHNIVYPADF